MRQVEAPKSIEPWRIICAAQSEPNYSEDRQVLIYAGEHEYECRFTLLEGGHCSCFGWQEVEWSATEYTTEELRKLLDERGVEWTYADGTVSFADNGRWYHAWAYSDGAMCVSMGYLTPEQAIAATLGRGTCAVVKRYEAQNRHEIGNEKVKLSCGHIVSRHDNFCPKCGREVQR